MQGLGFLGFRLMVSCATRLLPRLPLPGDAKGLCDRLCVLFLGGSWVSGFKLDQAAA